MVKGDYIVYLTVIDSYVYDFDQNVVDIIYGLQNYDRVILNLKDEAVDFQCLGVTPTIEKIIKTYNVEFGRIVLETTNLREAYNNIEVVRINATHHKRYDQKFADLVTNQLAEQFTLNSHNKEITKYFGCYVSRSNYPRLAFASYLYQNYQEKVDLTYHLDPSSDYHKSHIGIEKLMHLFGSNSVIVKNALTFLPKTPILPSNENIVSYPIVGSSQSLIDRYKNIFLDLVLETFFSGETISTSEKTFRCFATKTPFLLFGAKDSLQFYKNHGFKTFNQWWDETYDEAGEQHRIVSMLRIIDSIATLPLSDIQSMYKEMETVLEHNYQHYHTKIKNRLASRK